MILAAPTISTLLLYLLYKNIVWKSTSSRSKVRTCRDADVRLILEENSVNINISKLLEGQIFSDVLRQSTFAGLLNCSMTKYSAGRRGLDVKVVNVLTNGDTYTFEESWVENKNKGSFKVTGFNDDDCVDYMEDVFSFYADEHALGYYACDTGDYGDVWRVVIATALNAGNRDEIQSSVAKAEKKMESIRALIGDTYRLPQTGCPKDV